MKLAARCRFVTTIALLALIAPHLSAEPSETDRGLAWVPVPSSGVAAPYVSAIAQGNNQIYVGGNFDTIAPITGSVALLDNTAVADGTNDGDEVIMEFPRLRGGVTAIYAVASDGNDGWYIGGDFSVTFGGLTFTNAMHVLDGGGINGDWRPNPNGIVRAIEVDTANDIVYLGGEFTSLSNSVGAAPWFDTDWPYRIAIAIDQTKVSVDESEFPVLISITDPALRDMANGGHVAQSDGGDILFIKDDATQAAHEIESYDRTTGTLVAWVEMPVSTTVTRTVYLYYGNTADASNQWDASGTWDGTSGEHEAVWHMDDGIEPDDGTIDDATGNGLTATAGNGAAEVAAFIGNGYVFDGSDDEITVGDDAAIQSQAPFTVSAWVKRSAIGEDD
ncbi:MAG: DUF2341 domain-containing protein, partial [Planctomycetaceae bacterium]|nr:DUF2341 domain-containing protein [Planctomycetaceae bacterium]